MPHGDQPAALKRTIGLVSGVSLNVMNMIGVGPFITLPLVVGAMGGPQAILGWVLGGLIAICDGLVWAELGAAMPRAGGSYAFLREIYRRTPEGDAEGFDAGRLLSFLYIWQLSFTAPLSIASGCIGLAQYAGYLWPGLHGRALPAAWFPAWTSLLAASVCALVVALLYRGVEAISRSARVLTVGVLATVCAVIIAGFTHMQPSLLRFTAPILAPGRAVPGSAFLEGLGLATLVATYDYWGYYTVCFLGAEVRDPARTIPRAVLLSIALVATLYLAMHVAVLGVVPWRELVADPHAGGTMRAAAALLMERTWGHVAAVTLSVFIMWTAFASVAALLLAYSRAPYAAAVDGNYFRVFARLHPRHGFPHISLLALGAAGMLFCFFDLAHVIAALVAVRIVLQYVLQQVGVMVLRWRRPEMDRPFRMWLYPLPPVVALSGFLFLLVSRRGAGRELLFAAAIGVSGAAVFFLRERSGSR
ncbi:MAG TPA: APC family permease [Acidobacteriaceae bacterium]